MSAYIPAQGDFVVMTFDPQAGREQMGRRPALVVSVTPFNKGTGLAMCCPVTNTKRDSAFHLVVPDNSGLTGFVMCEQMKSLDFRVRRMKPVGKAPRDFLEEVLSVIDACIFPKAENGGEIH